MASRKQLDTGPHLEGGVKDYPVPSVALSENGMATAVRLIKRGRVAQVDQLARAVQTAMKRLRLRSKKTDPLPMPPDGVGSEQVNVGGLANWAASVKKRDKAAKEQLTALAATIRARLA